MKQLINPSINIYPRISKVYSFQQTQESPVRAELSHNFSTSTKNMFRDRRRKRRNMKTKTHLWNIFRKWKYRKVLKIHQPYQPLPVQSPLPSHYQSSRSLTRLFVSRCNRYRFIRGLLTKIFERKKIRGFHDAKPFQSSDGESKSTKT